VPIRGTPTASGSRRTPPRSTSALSAEEIARLEEVVPRDLVAGTRYPEASMALLNG